MQLGFLRMGKIEYNLKGEKRCSKCGEFKDTSLFFKFTGKPDDLRPECKACTKETQTRVNQTKIGLLTKMFAGQKVRTKIKSLPAIGYSKEEFIRYALNSNTFLVLYSNWVKSGFSKALIPSADRDDDYKGYSTSNITFMTWESNNIKGLTDRNNKVNNKLRVPIIGVNIKTLEVLRFDSIKEAEEATGAVNISRACKSPSGKSCGYKWKYDTK